MLKMKHMLQSFLKLKLKTLHHCLRRCLKQTESQLWVPFNLYWTVESQHPKLGHNRNEERCSGFLPFWSCQTLCKANGCFPRRKTGLHWANFDGAGSFKAMPSAYALINASITQLSDIISTLHDKVPAMHTVIAVLLDTHRFKRLCAKQTTVAGK